MNKLAGFVVVLVFAASGTAQQPLLRVVTHPLPPTRDVLDRLNLAQGWRTRIPLNSGRDGIFSVQLIPDAAGLQLLVQTAYGSVILLDAETGDTLWRTSVGVPFWELQPATYNSSVIFATRRDMLYVLDRRTGRQRVFTLDKDSKLPNYGFKLLGAPSTSPVADDDSVFFCIESRVTGYLVPPYPAIDKARAEHKDPESLHLLDHIEYEWNQVLPGHYFQRPPLLTGGRVALVSTNGTFMSVNRFTGVSSSEFEYQFNKGVSGGMGQHGDMAYIGSDDYTLYAMHIGNVALRWRFLGGAPIQRQPAVTDRDVYATPLGRGLYRLDRDSGRPQWRNLRGEQFLAVNQRFVYAADRMGKLLVLDYARGSELAHYDLSDYTIRVSNEWNDRMYFAGQDGQILCLHHRDNLTPVRTKYTEVKKPPVKLKEEKKDEREEKKDEEKKENKKGDKKEKKDDARLWKSALQIADCRLQIEKDMLSDWASRHPRHGEIADDDRSGKPHVFAANLQSAICNLQSSPNLQSLTRRMQPRCSPGA